MLTLSFFAMSFCLMRAGFPRRPDAGGEFEVVGHDDMMAGRWRVLAGLTGIRQSLPRFRLVPTEIRQRGTRRRPNMKLKGLRINEGLGRDDLAIRAGVSRETVRLIENGWVPGPRVQFGNRQRLRSSSLDIWPHRNAGAA